jgi:hypothetical protein
LSHPPRLKRNRALASAGGGQTSQGWFAMSHTHYTPTHGKVKDGVYRKVVFGSRHLLRVPRSWCIDCDDLAAVDNQATVIDVYDEESKITYSTSIEFFKAHAFRVSRGHGPQLGLEIRQWSITAPLVTGAIKPKQYASPQLGPRQISLFEGVKYGR